jgi:hypothetical protein
LLSNATYTRYDKGHSPHKALPILKEWKVAIESMGFERYRYDRLRSVHAVGLRKFNLVDP